MELQALCDLITPIIWSKLELYDVKQSTTFECNAVEPNIASPVSHEGTHFSKEKARHKVWVSLNLDTLDALYREQTVGSAID